MAVPEENDGYHMEIAAMQGNCDDIRTIYQRNKGSINNRGNWDWTPLMRAAHAGQNEAAAVLINECKADVNFIAKYGHTALHIASMKGHTQIIKDLIHNGGNVNSIDDMKRTPLMMSSENGYCESVKILLSHDAEIERKNEDNKTAKDMAKPDSNVYRVLEEMENIPAEKRQTIDCECKHLRNDMGNITKRVDSMQMEINDIKRAQINTDDHNRSIQQSHSPGAQCNGRRGYERHESISSVEIELLSALWSSKDFSRQTSQTSPGPSRSSTALTMDTSLGSDDAFSEKILNRLARKIGDEWRDIAFELDFKDQEIQQIKAQVPQTETNYLVAVTFQILKKWRSRNEHLSDEDKYNMLRRAFQEIEKQSLVHQLDQLVDISSIKEAGNKQVRLEREVETLRQKVEALKAQSDRTSHQQNDNYKKDMEDLKRSLILKMDEQHAQEQKDKQRHRQISATRYLAE